MGMKKLTEEADDDANKRAIHEVDRVSHPTLAKSIPPVVFTYYVCIS